MICHGQRTDCPTLVLYTSDLHDLCTSHVSLTRSAERFDIRDRFAARALREEFDFSLRDKNAPEVLECTFGHLNNIVKLPHHYHRQFAILNVSPKQHEPKKLQHQ